MNGWRCNHEKESDRAACTEKSSRKRTHSHTTGVGKILILNIYQAKDLLVRYCINYETGEHEYWIEQHGWRKGGILNALNEDWRDWEWRYYENYPKLQKKDADRIRELIRERGWHDSPWEKSTDWSTGITGKSGRIQK